MRSMKSTGLPMLVKDKRQVNPTGKVPTNQVEHVKDSVLKAFEAASNGMPIDQLKVACYSLASYFETAGDMAGAK